MDVNQIPPSQQVPELHTGSRTRKRSIRRNSSASPETRTAVPAPAPRSSLPATLMRVPGTPSPSGPPSPETRIAVPAPAPALAVRLGDRLEAEEVARAVADTLLTAGPSLPAAPTEVPGPSSLPGPPSPAVRVAGEDGLGVGVDVGAGTAVSVAGEGGPDSAVTGPAVSVAGEDGLVAGAGAGAGTAVRDSGDGGLGTPVSVADMISDISELEMVVKDQAEVIRVLTRRLNVEIKKRKDVEDCLYGTQTNNTDSEQRSAIAIKEMLKQDKEEQVLHHHPHRHVLTMCSCSRVHVFAYTCSCVRVHVFICSEHVFTCSCT